MKAGDPGRTRTEPPPNDALEAASAYSLETDLQTGLVLASEAFKSLIGQPPDRDLDFADFAAAIHPDDRDGFDLDLLRSLPAGHLFEDEFGLITSAGDQRRFVGRGRVIPNELGSGTRMLGVLVDITEQREAEGAYRVLVEVTNDAFVGMDAAGLTTEWNAAAEQMFGRSRAEVLARPLAELIIPDRYRQSHAAAIEEILSGSEEIPHVRGPLEMTALRADGTEFPVEISLAALQVSEGVTFRAFIRDITTRKKMEGRLLERALTDELTALPNRALLDDRLAQALAGLSRSKSRMAVLFIDVDRFKVVNDSLGHTAGDRLLREIAIRFQAALRPADTVARFGGDEFVVICQDVDEAQAAGLARRLLETLDPPIELHGRKIHTNVSIGIVMTRDPESRAEDLLRDADAAMYRAKERGGGRAEMFDEATRTRAVARLELEADLRRAIDGDELVLEYQPLFELEGSMARGVEALVRWNHPTRGLSMPGEFIPLAEETGLIIPLGTKVLQMALRQLAVWDADGGPMLSVAVNVSARQLADPDVVEVVKQALTASGIAPQRLWLEITESVLMEDADAAMKVLSDLRNLGVSLAIDDFGTGYSSLLYLRTFPVQQLKLDRSFISGLGSIPGDGTIVRTVIDLAHSLGLQVLAEGIETSEQAAVLRAMGCDLGQGFLWSGAVPAQAIADMTCETENTRTLAVGSGPPPSGSGSRTAP